MARWRCQPHFLTTSSYLEASWAHLGLIFGHLGLSLGLSWAILGSSWAIFGLLGAILDPCWFMLGFKNGDFAWEVLQKWQDRVAKRMLS